MKMIVLRGIRFESHCEHHRAPIIGQAWVAYVPSGGVVGISKLARVVEVYARCVCAMISELRHSPKDEMFGRDKGFKCPNLPWTAPGFQVMKGIIHAPCAKPALRPESRDALLTAIAKSFMFPRLCSSFSADLHGFSGELIRDALARFPKLALPKPFESGNLSANSRHPVVVG